MLPSVRLLPGKNQETSPLFSVDGSSFGSGAPQFLQKLPSASAPQLLQNIMFTSFQISCIIIKHFYTKEEPSTEKSNESIDAEYKVYDEEEDQKQKDKQKNVKVTIKNKRGGSSRNTTTKKRKRRSALSSGGDAV